MQNLKALTKSLISGLPGPIAVATWDVIWTVKSPLFRVQRRTQRALYNRLGRPDRLLGGPFAEMRYIQRATGSAFLPKLVGTYELEIVEAVQEIMEEPPDLIVDIGAAEGYYAVGFARRLSQTRIIAYDNYKPARYLLHGLAKLNGLSERIDVRAVCSPSAIDSELRSAAKPLILCDCEGYEDDLLRPDLSAQLARANLLVEIHEYFRPGVGSRMRERFQATHSIVEYRTQARDPSLLPPGLDLNQEEATEVMNEHRAGAMEWLYMKPLSRSAG